MAWAMRGSPPKARCCPTPATPSGRARFPDVAIVHNGQITDYFTWRERLERLGYRFLTENDSELIAVWVSDQMRQGLSMEQALKKSITSIDGVFTYMIANIDGIGFAKDRFAMKPLVVVQQDHELAAATEEQAVRRINADEVDVINYDGPSLTTLCGRSATMRWLACIAMADSTIIDVGKRHIREINEEIQAAAAAGRAITVRNTLSRHNLGIGLPPGARPQVRGECRLLLRRPEYRRGDRHRAQCRLGAGRGHVVWKNHRRRLCRHVLRGGDDRRHDPCQRRCAARAAAWR